MCVETRQTLHCFIIGWEHVSSDVDLTVVSHEIASEIVSSFTSGWFIRAAVAPSIEQMIESRTAQIGQQAERSGTNIQINGGPVAARAPCP